MLCSRHDGLHLSCASDNVMLWTLTFVATSRTHQLLACDIVPETHLQNLASTVQVRENVVRKPLSYLLRRATPGKVRWTSQCNQSRLLVRAKPLYVVAQGGLSDDVVPHSNLTCARTVPRYRIMVWRRTNCPFTSILQLR